MGRVGATNVVVLEVGAIAGRAGLGMGALVETKSEVVVAELGRVTERLKRDTIADRSKLLSALLSIRTANKNVDMLNLLSIFVFSNNRKYEF